MEQLVRKIKLASCHVSVAHELSGLGSGPGVFEIVEDFDGNAYRAVDTVRFKCAVYVLHAFQKKSHIGRKTPLSDVKLVEKRLKAAREKYEADYGKDEN